MIHNNLNQLFVQKKQNLLSIYFTAGYPKLNDTLKIITALSLAKVDFIEIGSAYNDPIADGLTIQNSANQALKNGMNLKFLFKQLEQLNELKKQQKITIPPLIWMGYFNFLIRYGIENFCQKLSQVGVSGLIIPDLSFEYYQTYQKIFEKYQLNFIFMISPTTPNERILEIDKKTNVFIYATSGQSITGQNSAINQNYLKNLQQLKLKNPIMIGFNIKDNASYQLACNYGSGAIIGSAFINHLKNNPLNSIEFFIDQIRT